MTDTCSTGNDYDGRMGLRISSIFVILVGSLLGALFPVIAKKNPGLKVPSWVFFFVKYFGSGVIVATAFIHLLSPANDALSDPCLPNIFQIYPWPQAIAMMAVFSLFFVELLALSFASFSVAGGDVVHEHDHDHSHSHEDKHNHNTERRTTLPGEDHMSHDREHNDIEEVNAFSTISDDKAEIEAKRIAHENYAAQMTSIFILEFGVIFHSIFIGLTLAVSGAEFQTLYVVLVFHQSFEGLGLGTRLAVVPFPKARWWTPYLMAVGYGIATPLAIAVGLGVRKSYPPGSQTTLIVNGIFDAISAGILLYTGLVELMAHEFLFSTTLRRGRRRNLFLAFLWMIAGAGLMSLLGRWA